MGFHWAVPRLVLPYPIARRWTVEAGGVKVLVITTRPLPCGSHWGALGNALQPRPLQLLLGNGTSQKLPCG